MYIFILNPIAGRGRSVKLFEEVKQIFDQAHAPYEVWTTQCAGHAQTLAQKAAADGYQNIISVGGDGTLLEVVSGLVGRSCNLGLIPAGTGNDFMRALGVPIDHLLAARTILAGHVRQIDVGITNQQHYFMNVAGTGFDTEVIRYTEKFKWISRGKLPYILGILYALFAYRSRPMRIVLDGTPMEKKVFLIAVANGKSYAGGMLVAPESSASDGLLDVTIIDALPNSKIPFVLPSFIKGKHHKIKQLTRYRCKEVSVEVLDKTMPINMDGELIGTTPVSFHACPGLLNMFAPDETCTA